jgi:hypothetical protein
MARDLGGSGAGHLNAAFGAGGVAGIVATATLVGRRRLTPALAAGTVVWGAAFLVIGLDPSVATAFIAPGRRRRRANRRRRCGPDAAAADRARRPARSTPPRRRLRPTRGLGIACDAIARVFGLLEGLTMAALAFGSLLTPLLVGLAGGRAAVIGVGAVLPLALLLAAPRLVAIDRRATVPVVEL